jgi:hypothetical protein
MLVAVSRARRVPPPLAAAAAAAARRMLQVAGVAAARVRQKNRRIECVKISTNLTYLFARELSRPRSPLWILNELLSLLSIFSPCTIIILMFSL